MKKYLWISLLILFPCFTPFRSAEAASTYILPYPSAMPGNVFYKLHLIMEKILQYWYFGDFGKFTYNLKESDKYLVEAKTLFEYDQYLLGFSALKKSDNFFRQINPDLLNAKKHGKNINDKKILLHQAALKHIEILEKIKGEVPSEFTWLPEKGNETHLDLLQKINVSEVMSKHNL